MKKAICYILGLVFSFFTGIAYMILLILISFEFPFGEHKLLIGLVFYIVLPILFLLFLIRYNFAAANSFGKMRYAPIMTGLGIASAIAGALLVLFDVLIPLPEKVLFIIIFATPFISYKVGRLIAKNYNKKSESSSEG